MMRQKENETYLDRYIDPNIGGKEEVFHDTNEEAVEHPSHYNSYSVEVLEMMRRIWGDDKVAIFCELNAFKYRMRMGLKDGNPIEQDLAKEKFYLEYVKKLDCEK